MRKEKEKIDKNKKNTKVRKANSYALGTNGQERWI